MFIAHSKEIQNALGSDSMTLTWRIGPGVFDTGCYMDFGDHFASCFSECFWKLKYANLLEVETFEPVLCCSNFVTAVTVETLQPARPPVS